MLAALVPSHKVEGYRTLSGDTGDTGDTVVFSTNLSEVKRRRLVMNTMTITVMSLWDASMHEFSAVVDNIEPKEILEEVFIRQQDDHKDIPEIPSLSSGDIVGINGALYLCKASGWEKMTNETLVKWLSSSSSQRKFSAMT